MKKVIIMLFALLHAFGVLGQLQQKVAIYIVEEDSCGLANYVSAAVIDAFVHNSNYAAVERTAEFLKAINTEHDYQRRGMIDEEQIAKLGKQFGTKLVCVVKIGKVVDKYFMQSRLIDVETTNIQNSTKPLIFRLDNTEEVCLRMVTQLLTEDRDSRTIQSVFGQ